MVNPILIAVDQIHLATHGAQITDITPPAHTAIVEWRILDIHTCGIFTHRTRLDILQPPWQTATLTATQIAEDKTAFAIIALVGRDHLDTGARARDTDEIEPGIG